MSSQHHRHHPAFMFTYKPAQASILKALSLPFRHYTSPMYFKILSKKSAAYAFLVCYDCCFDGRDDGEVICCWRLDSTIWQVNQCGLRTTPEPLSPFSHTKQSSFLVFIICHQPVYGFPTSPLSKRHSNGSLMENPLSDEKGEKD